MSTPARRHLAGAVIWLAASALLLAYPTARDRPGLWLLGALAGGYLAIWYTKLDKDSKLILGRTAEMLTLAAGVVMVVFAFVGKGVRWSGLVVGTLAILDILSRWVAPGAKHGSQ